MTGRLQVLAESGFNAIYPEHYAIAINFGQTFDKAIITHVNPSGCSVYSVSTDS